MSDLFDQPDVDKLVVLCEEVMRATPESAHRFIEPAPGVLARTTSKQHSLVFGRRGSGKSSLLRKAAADLTLDRRPIAYVDMETFKGHSYPDVLISVLIKTLQEFDLWLGNAATARATKKTFWARLYGTSPKRPPFNKSETNKLRSELSDIILRLENVLQAPETAEVELHQSSASESKNEIRGGVTMGGHGASLTASGASDKETKQRVDFSSKYTSHKIEYLHQNIMKFQKFFNDLSSLSNGPAFLILDDLYYIRKADQAKVIDYFHRIAKSNNVWVKIGTIKHRSEWYLHSDPPIGMKLGDDAREINIDVSLEKFETLKLFLAKILNNMLSDTPSLTINGMMNRSAFDRLVVASGGVTRDFIGIFSNAISQAKNRGSDHHRGPKIGAEDVNLATGEYAPVKQEEFKLDAQSDQDALESAFQKLVKFCTVKSKCNVFLVSRRLVGPTRDAIDQLIDLRVIHPVKSRVTLKHGAQGELYEAFMLDLSQYTGARAVHQFKIVDLKDANKDETIRKSSYIYDGSWVS